MGAPGSIVAFGCSDRVLRLWDARSRQGEALSVKPLPGHAGWVVGLTWSPSSPYHVATASHDHTVKVGKAGIRELLPKPGSKNTIWSPAQLLKLEVRQRCACLPV